ncbi:unnamed protein product [Durusdinium trenchii]|uniref:Uncharacterized protein n=2 Tax=Durusdinium trenchii TaxID=1381693 RepID=A0ABP0QNQ4_9DINO
MATSHDEPTKSHAFGLSFRARIAIALGPISAALLIWLVPERQLKVHVLVDLRVTVLLLAAACGFWVWLHDTNASEREKATAKPVFSAENAAELKALKALQEDMLAALGEMKVQQMKRDQEDIAQQCAEEREKQIALLYKELEGSSGVLVHRFPEMGSSQCGKVTRVQSSFGYWQAAAIETGEGTWSSPIFSACNRLWSIRLGKHSTIAKSLYFCILPHGHKDRLRCWFLFARPPGKGYKEWPVHDWPPELAGHPWGPSVPLEEIEDYKQADGSILLLVHATTLQAVATEIHFKSWSKELKSFMHGKKTEDYLIRDRHGHNIQWHDSTIEPPASDQFPLVILHRQE